MSLEELRRENDHLKAEVQKLNEELAESNKNGNIAAEAGMSLLKANQENQEKYEEDTKIYQEQIEVFLNPLIISSSQWYLVLI